MGLDRKSITQDEIISYVRVTHEEVWKKIQKNVKTMYKSKVMFLKIYKERPDLWAKCCNYCMSRRGFSSVTITNMNLCSKGSYLYLRVPHQVSFGG